MSSVQMEIDTSSLKTDRSTVKAELKQVLKEVTLLREDMAKLGQSWTGSASTAYQARMAEDVESTVSICTYLQEYLSCMTEAESAYTACEKSIRSIVNQIKV